MENEKKGLLCEVLDKNLSDDEKQWLNEQLEVAIKSENKLKFNLLFSAIPRKIGKEIVSDTDFEGWSIARLCRVYALAHLNESDENNYFSRIEELFSVADMAEQEALYSALPYYKYPDLFVKRTIEGIRTNITDVFDAIALGNTYPAKFLDEKAWNQMVLKAFFMQRPVYWIIDIDKRANKQLVQILSDYAHERWAAGRPVSPELWRCWAKFLDDSLFEDIQRLLEGSDLYNVEAAVLLASCTQYQPAKSILTKFPDMAGKVQSGELTWGSLGRLCENA